MQGRLIYLLLLLLLSTSCSERQLYKGIKDTRKSHCYELPTDQRTRCLDELSTMDYDEYLRELEKIKTQTDPG